MVGVVEVCEGGGEVVGVGVLLEGKLCVGVGSFDVEDSPVCFVVASNALAVGVGGGHHGACFFVVRVKENDACGGDCSDEVLVVGVGVFEGGVPF